MDLDIVDLELARAARGASPERYPPTRGSVEAARRMSHEVERIVTASSVSTSSSEGAAVRREIGMSRAPTQRDLERHPTELSRIHTQKTQHSYTIGRGPKSRQSKKPLPEFGAGKPYPPLLPAQEEYVVEFSGADDPMHAQVCHTLHPLVTLSNNLLL